MFSSENFHWKSKKLPEKPFLCGSKIHIILLSALKEYGHQNNQRLSGDNKEERRYISLDLDREPRRIRTDY